VSPARENQSGTLVQDADTLRELSAAELQSFLSLGSPPGVQGNWAAASGNSGSAGPDLSAVARRIAQDLSREELEVTRQESLSGSLPPQVDRRLLLAGSNEVGGAALSSEQKRELRAAFIDLLRER
jgi:hypothetical protein